MRADVQLAAGEGKRSGAMKVFMFHLMPYAYLDMSFSEKYRSAWVVLPNTYFDPKKGHELYNRYLDELELAAELGFDGISVNEHHQNAYGLMPSPVVMASALSRRTKAAKIAILGNAFCLREHPLTLAEEHAMLDCITGGRLISGMVRGIGAEYYSMGSNPAFSHARFQEAHDLVVQAWTRPGPFAFEGKFYHFEYVNVWPRPYQQPHPPIWTPSTGSSETIEWAAHPSRKYVYLQTYSPIASVARFLNYYRESAQRLYGYTASSEQVGWCAPVYVSDTDEKARAEAAAHIEALFNKLLRQPFQMIFPPGYLSAKSLKNMLSHKRSVTGQEHTVDTLIEQGIILCGSPDSVRKQLVDSHRLLGFQNFLAMLQFATLPRDLTDKNIRIFAREVLPVLQTLTDREYAGLQTQAAE
jgi:alkanesulfonate monooxygenase SsuD/methylene tetrahydromethanopterin reductase-like flavin-dependent oxidoreductase (luciferase family)